MSTVSKLRRLSSGHQTMLNIVSSIISVVISAIISFFLTPHIVGKIGKEAHGFIGLATNIISYVSLGAIAINTVSSRFVAVSYHAGDVSRANQFYSATVAGNIISVFLISIPSVAIILNINRLINVPSAFILDLKLLLGFLLTNFIVSTLINHWSIAPFVKNLLFINSMRDMISALFRAIVLIILYGLFSARMFYMGIGAMAATCIASIYAGYFHYKLLPEIKIRIDKEIVSDIKMLIASGVWNVINTGGVLLLNGLDLLLANTFLGPGEMGMVSVSKVIPTMLITLVGTLPNIFAPTLTKLYAQNNLEGIVQNVTYANKISSFILGIPIYGFFVYSYDFYKLWMIGQDASLLSFLSILTLVPMALLGGMNSVYVLFTVTNKLKTNAILVLISGIISTVAVLFALKYTNLGAYAIVGISSITVILRQILYAIPYSAQAIGKPKHQFYMDIIYILIIGLMTLSIGIVFKNIIPATSWLSFFISIILTAVFSYVLSFFVVFSKSEKTKLFGLLRFRKESN